MDSCCVCFSVLWVRAIAYAAISSFSSACRPSPQPTTSSNARIRRLNEVPLQLPPQIAASPDRRRRPGRDGERHQLRLLGLRADQHPARAVRRAEGRGPEQPRREGEEGGGRCGREEGGREGGGEGPGASDCGVEGLRGRHCEYTGRDGRYRPEDPGRVRGRDSGVRFDE